MNSCQLCKKWDDCENAYDDPVFGEHGFDFKCLELTYLTEAQYLERTGEPLRGDAFVWYRDHNTKMNDDAPVIITEWKAGYYRDVNMVDVYHPASWREIVIPNGPYPPGRSF